MFLIFVCLSYFFTMWKKRCIDSLYLFYILQQLLSFITFPPRWIFFSRQFCCRLKIPKPFLMTVVDMQIIFYKFKFRPVQMFVAYQKRAHLESFCRNCIFQVMRNSISNVMPYVVSFLKCAIHCKNDGSVGSWDCPYCPLSIIRRCEFEILTTRNSI